MVKNKKVFTVLATALLLTSISVSVSAASSTPNASDAPARIVQVVPSSNFVDNLNTTQIKTNSTVQVTDVSNITVPLSTEPVQVLTEKKVAARGNNAPTNFWNLANNSYAGSFSYVEDNVFTNYYFPVNGEKIIYINVTTTPVNHGATGKYRIVAYELTTGNVAATYKGTVGITANAMFYNLNQNKTYYFGILNDMDSPIDGSLTVFH